MSSDVSVKVNIADNIYPLKVKAEEEARVHQAAQWVNDRVRQYRDTFGVADKQLLLSMVAFGFASDLLTLTEKNDKEAQDLANLLTALEGELPKGLL